MRTTSPLRYPGGKASLVGFLEEVINENDLDGGSYCEPFAGGAGAALGLLRQRVVSDVYLNDLDPGIFAFWRAVLDDTDRFVAAIWDVSVDVDEWKRQREVLLDGYRRESLSFDFGFATFYLNRCSRSGIIVGSAPIGGYRQTGDWLVDARFNKEGLVKRIRWIEERKRRIHLSNRDAVEFLEKEVPGVLGKGRSFVYFDPPYYRNGHRLYAKSFRAEDHSRLAQYVKGRRRLRWIMSYDDAPAIRELYGGLVRRRSSRRYSLQDRGEKPELVIAPPGVRLPERVD